MQVMTKGMVIIMKRIGVLALQGAFAEHIHVLEQLGTKTLELRQKKDLINNSLDGIIIPGGESTVIGKLLKELDMHDYIRELINDGIPVMGTCAGMILMARDITNDTNRYLSVMDITVKRNAYGRQLGSFRIESGFKGIGNIPMTFIRAPYIEAVNDKAGVEILAIVNKKIVAARQRNMLVTSFHPELDSNTEVHKYFLKI
jgi:5'-phosphate synthase pdxT subunit